MTHARQLAYRFLTLPYHVRIEVATSLGLIKDEDKGVADRILFERFFFRASEGRELELLWREVEERHGGAATIDGNPYKGL